MNRNVESRFALNPTNIDMPRSKFDMSHNIKTSFNVGDLVPIDWLEVLPGDSFSVDTSKVVRLQTLITPMMDSLYLDTYWFFVPQRLTWEHTKEFFGENTESAWIPETEYEEPYLNAPEGGWNVGTIADYMGIPTGVSGIQPSALPFRAYAKICNEWFRDENLTDPLNIPMDETIVNGSNGDNYINDVALGGKPFKVAKYHDYFTSCLPSPQKGPDVTISIGEFKANVVGNGYGLGLTDGTNLGGLGVYGYPEVKSGNYGKTIGSAATSGAMTGDVVYGVPTVDQLGEHPEYSGLEVLSGGNVNVATINQLRQAFQVQKFYEKCARGGTRYIELLKSMFGVTSPDARLQRPEYLGGSRKPLNVSQVVQSSSTDSTTPQGNVAGYSVTVDTHSDFTHSFTEHGYVIGLACVRYKHSYQQGLAKKWTRRNKFSYYWPLFSNLGEQAVENRCIYSQGENVINPSTGKSYDSEVFGYQEAWAEYRYQPDIITGEMRSTYEQSLDSWHLGDHYESLPSLSDSWIREDKSNVNRVIAVSDTLANQLFADIYVKCHATRCMPVYSIPGLIDHH